MMTLGKVGFNVEYNEENTNLFRHITELEKKYLGCKRAKIISNPKSTLKARLLLNGILVREKDKRSINSFIDICKDYQDDDFYNKLCQKMHISYDTLLSWIIGVKVCGDKENAFIEKYFGRSAK